MMTTQQFCVKWNSYSSNLQSMFPRLLTSEHFVDITLACEGQMIKCHKVVLSACSTYFEQLLVQNPCQHPIIFMKDMKHWEVQALVDFMYKGEVNVSQEELNSLLIAAEALQIRGLCGSDNACRGQQDTNSQTITSPVNKISTVSLPNDIVLSGSPVVPRDSQPQKKRKLPNDEKEQTQPNAPSTPNTTNVSNVPRISNVSSVSSNKILLDANSVHPSHPSNDQFRSDGTEEVEEDMKEKNIKQEMDTDDHFLEGDIDGDGPEDDLGALEQQEDSDSNNRDDVHSNTALDQPGPSGITTNAAPDKAATAQYMPLMEERYDMAMTIRKTRRKSQDQDILVAAAIQVLQGVSLRQASEKYRVARTTLYDFMKRHGFLNQWTGGRKRHVSPRKIPSVL